MTMRIALTLFCAAVPLAVPAVEGPRIELSAQRTLETEAVRIVVRGLEPWARVTLRLETSFAGQTYAAEADFQADAVGLVEIDSQPPLSGSYASVDPLGLFWSMVPVKEVAMQEGVADGPADGDEESPSESPEPWRIPEPRRYELSATVDGEVVASTTLERATVAGGVRTRRLAEGPLRGVLWLPPGDGPHPAVLVVSGSGGGYPNEAASRLANRGYAALALAHFAVPGLPEQLVEIPLEYFQEGLDWLATQPEIDPQRFAVMGGSRGGELALLLGSVEPRLRAVVAWVPSHVVWGGCCDETSYNRSAWSFRGKSVPFMTPAGLAMTAPLYWDAANSFLTSFWLALANEQAVEAAAITVERIGGAVLLLTGGRDELWPSAYMADQVVARLRHHDFSHPVVHVRFNDAGHGFAAAVPDYPAQRAIEIEHPVAEERMGLGGTREATVAAGSEAWRLLEEFLRENL